jgi:hypothetical protein
VRGLDHIVLAVRDLEAARSRLAALGFTTTPKALHPWGTANSLVQMEGSFIELLGLDDPAKIVAPGPGEFSFGDYNRRYLAQREGMSMLVFSSDDAAADLARWRREGLETYAPFDFSRSATLPSGEQVTVAFSLAFVTHPEMPWAAWFVCQQHNPEHFWKPEYQRHDNAAHTMERVWMQAQAPERYAEFLSRLFPGARLREEDAGVTLELERGSVAVRRRDRLAARFPWLRLPGATESPAFVAVTLARAGGGAAPVIAEQVCGLGLEVA